MRLPLASLKRLLAIISQLEGSPNIITSTPFFIFLFGDNPCSALIDSLCTRVNSDISIRRNFDLKLVKKILEHAFLYSA
ncbi:MAG: hypothetical protein CMM39_05125 [Rhodospirillaceae bacterium]|nr:hypothetical protein [Rhodospirillaceae bacterium]